MAFQFELQEDIEGPFLDEEGSRVAEFALGYDVAAETVVVMSVMLLPTHRSDTKELCFGIRVKEVAEGGLVSGPDYRREAVVAFVPEASRPAVHRKVIEAVGILVDGQDAENITMETFYPNLPEKALAKYTGICIALSTHRYRVADQFRDAETGIDFWLFQRRR